MGQLRHELPAVPDTEALGARLAAAIRATGSQALLVLLRGSLGAGKTTLVRGLLRSLGHTGAVPSPTYTLIEPYELGGLRVNHLDLYRLGDADELEFLGWRELGDAICLVEWPERAPALAENADLEILLRLSGEGREALIEACSEPGRRVLARLSSVLPATAGDSHGIESRRA